MTRQFEFTQSEKQRYQSKPKMNKASVTYVILTEDLKFMSLESQEERRKGVGMKKYRSSSTYNTVQIKPS